MSAAEYTVRDVMSGDVVTISETDTLHQAIDLMELKECRHLVVVDNDKKVAGIISDRDCRLAQYSPFIMRERWQDETVLDHTLIGAIMTPHPRMIKATTPLAQAAQLMLEYRISALVVEEEGELLGIVTSSDVLRAFIKLSAVD